MLVQTVIVALTPFQDYQVVISKKGQIKRQYMNILYKKNKAHSIN